MAKDSPRGINTIFQQTSSALKAARQTQIFSRFKRNIPYLNKFNPSIFIKKVKSGTNKHSKRNISIGKKLTKFAKKVK
jgi:hypothetical protein